MGISDSLGINSIAIRLISCCFVIVTRGDLREEFSMADDAFALSPISARASLPSEEDYAAIAEAFMETSRGRWFLTEYAKRNRNADTRMVLDAVARIEQGLAAQKEESLQKETNLHREENLHKETLEAHQQQAADAEAAATAARNNLNDTLVAMRGAVEAAQQSAAEALDNLALEARLAPVRKGARVLREIAWRLREIGNDGRICDLIDSQVAVIEAGAEQITSYDAKAALGAAFAALEGRLSEFGGDGHTPVPAVDPEATAPSPAFQGMPPAEIAEAVVATAFVQQAREAFAASPAEPAVDTSAQAANAAPVAEFPVAAVQAQETKSRLAEAQYEEIKNAQVQEAKAPAVEALDADTNDEALLDMIAMEMGAPDPISDAEIAAAAAEQASLHSHLRTNLVQPAPVEPAMAPEPVAVPVPPVPKAVQPPPPRAIEPAPAPAPSPEPAPAAPAGVSLGSTIIASGMLRKPANPANDPLAPIRRMSQAEKIAFFS
jgi:hypothetical protein